MNKYLLGLALCTLVSVGASAQSTEPINVVTTAVPFLRISPDARAGGMGETGLATDADASSHFFNIAKIPFSTDSNAIGATYSPWLKKLGLNDVYYATVSGFYKLDENQALSGSLRYFSLGTLQFTDNSGTDFGSGRPREFAIEAGYSRKLSSKLALGVGMKYINSNLIGGKNMNGVNYRSGNAVAGDLSVYYNNKKFDGSGWSFGAALSNLGTKIGYTSNADEKDYIPANLGIGASYTKVFDDDNKINFALDVNKLLVPTPPSSSDSAGIANYRNKSVVNSWMSSLGDAPGGFSEELKEVMIGTGMEYWYQDQFAARAGYFYENKMKGNRRYFTVGLGINYSKFGLNFSYIVPAGSGIDQNPLSNTLRFALTVRGL